MRATFQQEINIAFWVLISEIIIIYPDDLAIFSNKEDHFDHLEVF